MASTIIDVPPKTPLTLRMLRAYYARVVPLSNYLVEILETPAGLTAEAVIEDLGKHLPKEGDGKVYTDLITGSFVALESASLEQRGKYKTFEPLVHMSDVIDRAQVKIFAKAQGKPSNIITSGYRSSEWRGEPGKSGGRRSGITSYFVNTMVTALQAPEWELLLERIGEDAIFHLLTETSIYVPLPNECLCQLTGAPLVHIKPPVQGIPTLMYENTEYDIARNGEKRKAEPGDLDARLGKKQKLNPSTSVANEEKSKKGAKLAKPVATRTPADIPFVRVRLFYSRPQRLPKTHRIAIGLPPTHVLNRLSIVKPSQTGGPSSPYGDEEHRDQMTKARHLSKYVFPRQYGLESAFTVPSTCDRYPAPKSSMIRAFSDREDEIKLKGPCKTPKRLKPVLELLEKMLRRHVKCGYKPLFDKICPSKLRDNTTSNVDSSAILELISEQSIQSIPQSAEKSIFSESSVSTHGPSLAAAHAKYKPKFAEFTCPHAQVYLYARLITKLVIPKAFWGCNNNWKLILKHVREYISGRRHETMTLHGALQGFSTTECNWLLPPSKSTVYHRSSVSESLKRRELLEEFIYWYFESFLLPLLKTTFYVTDSSAFRNKLLYFRHDDWETLCKPLLDRLASNTFQRIDQRDAEACLQHRKLGFSFVRLLPKDTGVRPIVNLRRRRKQNPDDPYDRSQSINQILQAAFQIITYEKEMQPKLLGASVFGPNEVYLNLKAYKARLLEQHGRIPKLWFVKVDVQACFDSIEQNKLLGILKRLISDDVYMIQRFGQITPIAGKIRRIYTKKAGPESEHPHFLTFAAQLASLLRHTILVDQVVYPFAYREDIIQLLEDHITSNIVKIGQDYYRQMVGIPQGSVLSSLLCSFFYGDLENTVLKSLLEDSGSTLMRLIDDYLFITTDLSHARKFLRIMDEGHPEYGCFVAKDKTLTNFDREPHLFGDLPLNQQSFPWCGYLINMSNLSVSADYSRFHETYITDSLTVDKGRRPGASFAHKMLQLGKQKSHIIYCDTTLNSPDVVYRNIHQNFMLTAMKMHHYIRGWGLNTNRNSKFLLGIVRQTISYTYATIRNKTSNCVALAGAGRCDINKKTVIWLGLHAFHAIFKQKPTAYKALLKALTFDMSLPRYCEAQLKSRHLVKQSLAGISNISF